MNAMHSLRSLIGVIWLVLLAGAAGAHEIRPAYLEINETAAGRFDVLWKQPSNGGFAVRLQPQVGNGLLEGKPDEESATNSFVVRRWKDLPFTRDSFDGQTVTVEGLAFTITDALVSINFANGQQIQEILKPQSPQLVIHLTDTGKLPVLAYLHLGVEHILTGYDHLSFVLGLLLLVGFNWRLLQTITAFTFAHSLTLAMAALGFVQVSAPVIEALVALSIAFVAVELLRAYRGQHGLTSHYPWLISFTFGLLHGFAFAGSLAEVGLPPRNIVWALLLFNFGVEIGQLLFVSAVLAMQVAARRITARLPQWTRYAAPYAIGASATFWMIQRVHFLIR